MSNVVSLDQARLIKEQQSLLINAEDERTNIFVSGRELTPNEWSDYKALNARQLLAEMTPSEVMEVLSVYHPNLIKSNQPLGTNRLMDSSIRDRFDYNLSYETSQLGERLTSVPIVLKVLLVTSPILAMALLAVLVFGGWL